MSETFIGGFDAFDQSAPQLSPHHRMPSSASIAPPPLPPKDGLPAYIGSPTTPQGPGHRLEGSAASYDPYAGLSPVGTPRMPEPTARMPEPSESTTVYEQVNNVVSTKQLTQMSAVERSRILRTALMEQHLQVRRPPRNLYACSYVSSSCVGPS